MSEWQPIETFPENEECYLACCDRVAGGFYQVVYWDSETRRLRVDDANISYDRGFFTHWKHLDLTPTDAKEIAALPAPPVEAKSEVVG